MEKYLDRLGAGAILASYLEDYAMRSDVIALALPRGGVPVGYEVALALSIPLDVFVVRKLGVPGHEELALGAIASGDTVVFNDQLIDELKLEEFALQDIKHSEQKELLRRERLYRGSRPFPELKGKTVILIDDGIATGATMRVAVKAIRAHNPVRIIIAVPVAAHSSCEEIAALVDEMICPVKPIKFYAVGMWYKHFSETSDKEVIELLEKLNFHRRYSR